MDHAVSPGVLELCDRTVTAGSKLDGHAHPVPTIHLADSLRRKGCERDVDILDNRRIPHGKAAVADHMGSSNRQGRRHGAEEDRHQRPPSI